MSGARHWYRIGASLETISAVGDWADIRTLKHYLGTLVMIDRMQQEKAASTNPDWPLVIADAVKATVEALTSKTTQQVAPDTAAAAPLQSSLRIVNLASRPKRWHRIGRMRGPLHSWKTSCGDWYNPQTMTVQLFEERGSGALCSLCHRR